MTGSSYYEKMNERLPFLISTGEMWLWLIIGLLRSSVFALPRIKYKFFYFLLNHQQHSKFSCGVSAINGCGLASSHTSSTSSLHTTFSPHQPSSHLTLYLCTLWFFHLPSSPPYPSLSPFLPCSLTSLFLLHCSLQFLATLLSLTLYLCIYLSLLTSFYIPVYLSLFPPLSFVFILLFFIRFIFAPFSLRRWDKHSLSYFVTPSFLLSLCHYFFCLLFLFTLIALSCLRFLSYSQSYSLNVMGHSYSLSVIFLAIYIW